MKNIKLSKEKDADCYLFQDNQLNIIIRNYSFVDDDKLINGFVGVITDKISLKSFNSFLKYDVLPLNDLVKLLAKVCGNGNFYNTPTFIKILKSK